MNIEDALYDVRAGAGGPLRNVQEQAEAAGVPLPTGSSSPGPSTRGS
ncbi:hypothetical protein [Streptomyces sp. NPDC008137]